MKKIMILGAGILQLPAIEKAEEMGLQAIAVDMNPKAVGFSVEVIQKEIISTIDTFAALEAAIRHQIDGIMTLATDIPLRTVAVVARKLNLVGITDDTALKATNKAVMRAAFKAAGVPVSMFFCVLSKKDYLKDVEMIRSAGYRCIIKPADNSGSRGIDLLSDFEPETIERDYEYSKQFSRSGNLMVEEYMEVLEVSVETLSVNGVCDVIRITDKLTSRSSYFVEMGHSEPSCLPDSVQEEIRKVAIAANRAIGIQGEPSHTEIKVTKDGLKIVELGGDNITTHLVPLLTGVDIIECCICIALGEKLDLESKFMKGTVIRYFKTGIGEIKSITGTMKAEIMLGIQQTSVVHDIGEQATEIRSSVDCVGFVIAQDETSQKAIWDCEEALKMVKVVVGAYLLASKKYKKYSLYLSGICCRYAPAAVEWGCRDAV